MHSSCAFKQFGWDNVTNSVPMAYIGARSRLNPADAVI